MGQLIFSDSTTTGSLSRAVAGGHARRLAHGIYTRDLTTDPAVLLRSNWLEVTAHAFPGAVISDRSAPLVLPDGSGRIYVVHRRLKPLTLPGIAVLPRAGHGPLPDDTAMPGGLFLASPARALLENLLPSRARAGKPRRTLSVPELHDWVVRMLRTEGKERLNAIRDRARQIAPELGLEPQFAALSDIIGAALGTEQVRTASPGLAAAQRGLPYDEQRERSFQVLTDHLRELAPTIRPVLPADLPRVALLPFFEAYFSNFIEGTEFGVSEAAEIVFKKLVPKNRPADAHDVLGTYELLANANEMRRRPGDFDGFIALLRSRHARLLRGRPEKRPGEFKQVANRAGTTEFVAPHLVLGTLERGFEKLQRLDDPFARAVMMMFIVSEVHPFDDGNGRIARVMMNAELEAEQQMRIIIPTVYRNEYLSALRAMTHNREPKALTRVLDFAQRYTQQVDFSTRETAEQILTATNAFVDSNYALERGIRLALPSMLPR